MPVPAFGPSIAIKLAALVNSILSILRQYLDTRSASFGFRIEPVRARLTPWQPSNSDVFA